MNTRLVTGILEDGEHRDVSDLLERCSQIRKLEYVVTWKSGSMLLHCDLDTIE